jgi:hypothetical protein
MRYAAQADLCADNRGVGAKAPPPQTVTQDHSAVVANLVFVFRETAADSRLDSEDGKQIRRDARSEQPLRFAIPCQVEVGDVAHECDVLEDVIRRVASRDGPRC